MHAPFRFLLHKAFAHGNQEGRQRTYVTSPSNHPPNYVSTHPAFNSAFILRLTWDSEAQRWLILVKPTDGGKAHLFVDLETAFLYIATLYPGLV